MLTLHCVLAPNYDTHTNDNYHTTGDADLSFVYSFLPPAGQKQREFMRNGMWLPDFMGLYVVRTATLIVVMSVAGGKMGEGLDADGGWLHQVAACAVAATALDGAALITSSKSPGKDTL